jgi:D-lactate dehydrogenase (cytochrome)
MLTEEHRTDLINRLGAGYVSAAGAELDLHSRDQSSHAARRPELVVWPETTAQVAAAAAYANAHGLPLTAWGAGSSLEGNPIPVQGGIVMDFGRMNRILTIHADDFQVTVQPGVLYKDMNKVLARQGLFFAPDPGANASLGGMIANNAAGIRTVKYGATRDNVLALEVVLADGQVIRTGSRSVKQSAGYDLTHLFIGSEGTLGLVTEATVRLAPLPQHFSAATVAFASTDAAAQAVCQIMGAGLDPAALELLDTATVGALNEAGGFDFPPVPRLLMEFHAAAAESLAVELAMVEEICAGLGGQAFTAGLGREARDRLWSARHHLHECFMRLHPGCGYLIADVAVPISGYPALFAEAAGVLQALDGVSGYLFGHAGDGNMHAMIT